MEAETLFSRCHPCICQLSSSSLLYSTYFVTSVLLLTLPVHTCVCAFVSLCEYVCLSVYLPACSQSVLRSANVGEFLTKTLSNTSEKPGVSQEHGRLQKTRSSNRHRVGRKSHGGPILDKELQETNECREQKKFSPGKRLPVGYPTPSGHPQILHIDVFN